MKRLNQAKLAKQLGISKSYLSMILNGQRRCPDHLKDFVNSEQHQLQIVPSKQRVVGSNPTRDARFQSDHKLKTAPEKS